MKKIKDQVDLVLIVLLGIFLRARIIARDDFWFDEAFTGLLTKVPLQSFKEIVSQDTHPPLFSYLCRGWTMIFGSSDISIRALPMIFGVATILAVYFLAKKMFGKDTAALSALFIAINPFLISYSVEARSYALYAFIVVLATYFLINKKILLFTTFSIIGIFTHFVFFSYLGVLMGYYLYMIFKKELKLAKQIPTFLVIATAFAISFHTASPKQELLNIDWVHKADLTNVSQSLAAYSYGVRVKSTGDHGVNNLDFPIDSKGMGMILFTLLIIGATTLIQRNKAKQKGNVNNVLVLSLLVIPQITLIAYGIITGNNIYIERYLLPSAIFYLIIMANILTELFRFEIAALLVFLFLLTLTRVQRPSYYSGMKMIASEFERTGDKIAFTSPVDFVIAKYYLYDNRHNVKIYDPQNPDLAYNWWPFIEDNDHLEDKKNVLFISPENSRMGPDFIRLEENPDFKNYQVYIATL